MLRFTLPPLLSWSEFLSAATAPPSIAYNSSRKAGGDWHGATWEEAIQLATDGWPLALDDADITVNELRASAGLSHAVTVLEPTWDVTGSEVDVGAYLAGVPECMVDAVPRRVSRRGKVITFLVPAGYASTIEHHAIINRGLALATLCVAIIDSGHSVEVWSGDTGILSAGRRETRYCGVARVICAGEPFDVGRLIFAIAHPAMLRRLWFGVWDAQPVPVAAAMMTQGYGVPTPCLPDDLPAEITEPYVFPHLTDNDRQWDELSTALSWCRRMFGELGLVQH